MKLNAFQLKVIALVLMFGEHFGTYLGSLLPERVPLYLTYAGRISNSKSETRYGGAVAISSPSSMKRNRSSHESKIR